MKPSSLYRSPQSYVFQLSINCYSPLMNTKMEPMYPHTRKFATHAPEIRHFGQPRLPFQVNPLVSLAYSQNNAKKP